MGSFVDAKVDLSSVFDGLDNLAGPVLTHLGRSMAVAGGEVLRDEAKLLAPVEDGVLKGAIYLAFKERQSTDDQATYSVSWNAKRAPHGHLIEFGHWQPYVVVHKPDGTYVTTKNLRPAPKWIAAHPFLGPALDSAGGLAASAMVARGRARLPELLAGAVE